MKMRIVEINPGKNSTALLNKGLKDFETLGYPTKKVNDSGYFCQDRFSLEQLIDEKNQFEYPGVPLKLEGYCDSGMKLMSQGWSILVMMVLFYNSY